MAKKKTVGPGTPAEPNTGAMRRRTPPTSSRKAADARPDPGIAEPGATPAAEPLDMAADMSVGAGSSDSTAAREPSHEEIAQAAYQRYLDRGGEHGSDWNDWLEAERSLRKGK